MIGRRKRAVLGIALSVDAVRALVLRGGHVTWAREADVGPDEPMEASLRAVLAEVLERYGRLPVAIAVGPAYAQLRYLHNLPAVRDTRMLTAIVQQSASRYFRQNGTPMITTPVAEGDPRSGWAGAIEAPVVQAVVDACRQERLHPITLVPTAAVLGHAARDGRFTWHDGDVALELRYDGRELRDCRCLPSRLAAAPDDDVALDDSLRALGADAMRFAAAFGAAHGGSASPLALRPGRSNAEREPSFTRLAVAAAACITSVVIAIVTPAISAARQESVALRQLASLSTSGDSAIAVQRALADSAKVLSELVTFQRSAPSTTLLLASLTRAIQKPTMLVNVRLDADGGMLTALTPSAALLLKMLENVPELAGAAISGSVTPENPIGVPLSSPMASVPGRTPMPPQPPARRLERVTVRFHWQGEGRAPAASPPGAR